jgi:hypothetical protein
MHQYYDYCDTYDSYDSGLALDGKNSVKTFSCELCKQSKFILKKSVNDPKFKCEECIQKKESVSDPHDVALNMPATTTTPTTTIPTLSFQASPAMLTMDGMYQPYQQYQPYQLEPGQQQQGQQQQEQQSQQPMLETTPQFSWRWFNFFV